MENRYETFTGLVLNISRCIDKIKNIEMKELNLKGKQVRCLYALYNKGEMGLVELAKICEEDKGALSRTIKELQHEGLVFVESDNEKKYKMPIGLTERGRNVGAFITKKIEKILSIAGGGVDERKREVLYETLSTISNNLTNICKEIGGKNG